LSHKTRYARKYADQISARAPGVNRGLKKFRYSRAIYGTLRPMLMRRRNGLTLDI